MDSETTCHLTNPKEILRKLFQCSAVVDNQLMMIVLSYYLEY